jgi:SAM-dependent methyltransferase
VIESAESVLRQQDLVTARFQSEASHWKDIYEQSGRDSSRVGSEVIRVRHEAALAWIDGLALPAGTRVLEVGGGAGVMTVALARRGYRVDAVDASEAMVELTRRHAGDAGCESLVSARTGDACALPFPDGTFDLTVAIGVISWLAQPDLAIREMARVTRPGGHVLLTAFNQIQLIGLIDPLRNPLLRPLKLGAKRLAEQRGLVEASASLTYHRRGKVDHFLSEAGLAKRQGTTLGFGPFTLFHREVFTAPFAISLHDRLQRLADRGVPCLRSTGMFYLVLAEKPDGGGCPFTR